MKSQMNMQLRTSVYYGFLCAASCFFFMLLLYFAGKYPLGKWSWLGTWIPIVFMIRGVKAHRDIDLGGSITYRQAFGTSYLVALSNAIMLCLLIFLFGILVGTNIISLMISESVEKLEKAKSFMTEEVYESAMNSLEEMKANQSYTLFRIVLGEFTVKSIGGIIVSMVVASFMKKEIRLSSATESDSV
jgi:hypothetical protein